MKKVLHIITGLHTGGAERALFNLVSNTKNESMTHVVISLKNGGIYKQRIVNLGIKVFSLRLNNPLRFFTCIFKIRNILKSEKPNIIQGWMYHGNLFTSICTLFTSSDVSIFWNIRHSLYDIKLEKPSTRLIIKMNALMSYRPNGIVYNSINSKKQHEDYGFDSSFGILIHNGINSIDIQKVNENRAFYRNFCNVEDNEILIGHIARYHPMKDHKAFFKAAVKLLSLNKNIKFIVIGRDTTSENKEISSLIPDLFFKNFIFLGERNDVLDIMPSIDLLCLSSAWGEGFPNVIAEAMSVNVPSLATNIGESNLIIGDTGYVVEPGDYNLLVEKIQLFIDLSDRQKDELRKKSRLRIESNFSIEKNIKSYSKLYNV